MRRAPAPVHTDDPGVGRYCRCAPCLAGYARDREAEVAIEVLIARGRTTSQVMKQLGVTYEQVQAAWLRMVGIKREQALRDVRCSA